jgi:hypothetical protein
VRISGSNAWIHHVPRQCEEYWLPTAFASFSFISPSVRHRVPSHFNWTLQRGGPMLVRVFGREEIKINLSLCFLIELHGAGMYVLFRSIVNTVRVGRQTSLGLIPGIDKKVPLKRPDQL